MQIIEMDTISSRGQIAIPTSIRERLWNTNLYRAIIGDTGGSL